jgi:hypothetical protein
VSGGSREPEDEAHRLIDKLPSPVQDGRGNGAGTGTKRRQPRAAECLSSAGVARDRPVERDNSAPRSRS